MSTKMKLKIVIAILRGYIFRVVAVAPFLFSSVARGFHYPVPSYFSQSAAHSFALHAGGSSSHGFGFDHFHYHGPFVPVPLNGWSFKPQSVSPGSIWSSLPPSTSTIHTEKPSTSTTTTTEHLSVTVPSDLKPSLQGWDTSYNVPCGTYTIHPLVIANVRYKSRGSRTPNAFSPWPHLSSPIIGRSRRREEERVFRPEGRTFQPIHHHSVPVSYPPPQTCVWNFQAFGHCKLKFTCSSFQMPALFRCEENYLDVTDAVTLDYRFCGSRKPRGSYVSTKERMKLTFASQPAYSLPTVFDCSVACVLEIVQKDVPRNNTRIELAAAITNEAAPFPNNNTPAFKYADCKCGIGGEPGYTTRIIGGSQTLPGEFPWTGALIRGNKPQPFCGAVLLNSFYLITAAHCIRVQDSRRDEGPIEVLLNEHDINGLLQGNDQKEIRRNKEGSNNKILRRKISKILIHPKYNNFTYDYDIALLRLEEPMTFPGGASVILSNEVNSTVEKMATASNLTDSKSEKEFFGRERSETKGESRQICPVCLPGENEGRSYYDADAIVTGFGLTKEGGIPSKHMMKATIKIFNMTACQQFYQGNNVIISERMMCAGHVLGKMDSCIGDSGGPLVVNEGNRHILVGVVSWGSGCGRPNKPGVYTKMTGEIVKWIRQHSFKDSVWCKD